MSHPIPLAVREQAASWLIALQEQPSNEAVRTQWQQWLDADAGHRRAWQCIETFSARLQGVSSPLAHATLTSPDSPQRRQAIKTLAVLLFAGGAVTVAQRQGAWQRIAADISTGTGERTGFDLADGSRIELNSGTALDIRHDASQRTLALRSGEILVTVASDPTARHFVVEMEEGTVRAPSGRFGVRRFDDAAGGRVAVYDGAVELHVRGGHLHRLEAGRQCDFRVDGIGAFALADENATAWTQGMIVAQDMPLPEFAAELARHRRGHLGCDPSLASVLVTGTFPLADTDRVLDMLHATLPVRLRTRTRYWVQLVPQQMA